MVESTLKKTTVLSVGAIQRARYLTERVVPTLAETERNVAAERVDRWRDASALRDDDRFAQRLADVGLTESAFHALQIPEAAHADDAESSTPPPWLSRLTAAYTGDPPPAAMPPGDVTISPDRGLLAPAQRLLDHTWCVLVDALEDARTATPGPTLGSATKLAGMLAKSLPLDVHRMLSRAAILELQIARFEERLAGDTPAARFTSFMEDAASAAGAIRFFEQYPVLARDLSVRCGQWITSSVELIERLLRDRDAIAEHFANGRPLGTVTSIEVGLSDRHNDGQSVAIITFSSGSGVVYKPRSLAVDAAFTGLLDWLNQRAEDTLPPLRVPAVLERDGYGWAERVVAGACTHGAELIRYYQRQGAHVALLYALEATDFHHENVIACGEYPMLIDLETVLQPIAGSVRLAEEDSRPIALNVLRNGLLPVRFSTDPNAEGFDISGLGGLDNPLIGAREPVQPGTDAMHYQQTQVPMPVQPNRPTLRGPDGDERPVLVWEHTDDVMAGFDTMMRLVATNRDALLADDGPIASFQGLELRHIARPTNLYVRLIEATRHPDFQQDGLAREQLIDKLWLDAEQYDHFRPLIVHERPALARFDVPRFRCQTDSRDLIAEDGTRIVDYFDKSPLTRVRRRIESLGEDERVRQGWLVRASILAIKPTDMGFRWQSRPLPPATKAFTSELALAWAQRAGESLAGISQQVGTDALSWFHLGLDANEDWRLEPVRADLYNGLTGVALFFAHLAQLAPAAEKKTAFHDLAQSALATTRLIQGAKAFAWSSIGLSNGLGGWLYVQAHLARLWRDDDWLTSVADDVRAVRALLDEDRGFDLLAGAAGAIVGLLAIHEAAPEIDDVLSVATACGDHLVAHAHERPECGIAWPAVDGSSQPLTGFAHGTAGFAWALARLAAATGEARFTEAAHNALRYERAFFDPAVGSWPDLRQQRSENGERSYFYAWCHGAPGIGLSRLGLLDLLDESADQDTLRAEVQAAVRATLVHGFGMNHGLCHGDLGNLDIVLQAADRLDEPSWREAGLDLAARLLTDLEKHGWRGGIGTGILQPGLMTGLAGIGYGLLRLADPKRVPSILRFDLPPG